MIARAPRRPFLRSTSQFVRAAFGTVRAGGWRLIALYIGSQLAIIIVALPIIRWLFAEALRAGGMVGVDLAALVPGRDLTVTTLLIVIIAMLAFWLLSLQLALLVSAVGRVRAGETLRIRVVVTDLGHISRKLLRPSSIPLLGLLFILMPLANFGFLSVLTRAISVPAFITGELQKTTSGSMILIVFFTTIAVLNLRFALALPIFALSDASGARAMGASWRLTRRPFTRLAALTAAAITVLIGGLSIAILSAVTLVPTAISDSITPDASVAVAGFSLAIAELVALVIGGVTVAALAAVLIAALVAWSDELPTKITLRDFSHRVEAPKVETTPAKRRRSTLTRVVVVAVFVAGIGGANMLIINEISRQPDTFVLAHRGFSLKGAENTVEGLEAANSVPSDIVEIDVMETSDHRFVVMHDANLARLTGVDQAIADSTFDELITMTVTDQFGNTGKIPSLEEYMDRARELDQRLLIEIKLHGGESPDLVPRLVAELEELGVLGDHIYHSLDKPIIEELKAYRPNLAVGYTMAFGGVDAPDTTADFIVVEGWSASPELQAAAKRKGLAYMVWTVNEPEYQRDLMRDDVDGIITDRPDLGVASRDEIDTETGVAGLLADIVGRFVRLG